MVTNKKLYSASKLLHNKSAQLGNVGVVRGSSSGSTLDVSSKKFFGAFLTFLALILWVIDIWNIPFLGGVYSGFNFNPQDFWNNWFSKFTFGNVWFDSMLIIVIFIFIFRYIKERTLPNPVEILSTFMLTLSITFLVANYSWMAFPKAVFHFLLIITFGIYIMRTTNYSTGAMVIFGLIFLDFFLYSTLLKFVPFLKYISLLGSLIIIWTFADSPSAFTGTMFFSLLVFIIIMTISNGAPASGFLFSESDIQKASLNDVFTKLELGITNYQAQISRTLQGQIQYAITGKVEQNQYEPLGVYLENVKPADSKYYENEDVVIWGTVRARTLDDPVNVKLGCYIKDGNNKIQTKDIDPPNAFPVFKLEEQDFACTFKKEFSNTLKSGSKTITAFADFNFETLAFLKVYFMDRERLRAMTRENLDPFVQFGIKDKKPVTIYTNGPAAIGMETTSPLVGVGSSYITFPTLSMSIQNNQGWQGRIKKFEEVILLLPKGVGLTSPETDCGERKFARYDGEMCKTVSCTKVNTECINVCENGYASDFDKNNCKASCDDKLKACQNDCSFLFEEEGQQYEGFALTKEDLEKINTKLAKDEQITGNFEFFRCKLSPNPEEVLQNTPITTKSIRAKIRYNYTIEKPVSVRIDRLTDAERATKIGDVAITGETKTERRVIELANSMSANPPLAVSVANWETRGSFNHCTDPASNCGTSNPDNVNCNPSGSCGVMQINKNAHPDLFTSGNSRLNTFGCIAGETAWDLDCNIKSGIGLLKQNYNAWSPDTSAYNVAVDNNCNPANNPSNNAKYKSYTGWDRALRAYNGFGCTAGADVNYVEEVNKIKEAKYSVK